MYTYISILRGINVSGKNLIKMDALKNLYADLGFAEVKTYIQSGNVIFQSTKHNISDIQQDIEQRIHSVFGFEVPVLVFDTSVFSNIVQKNPFLKDATKDQSLLHITFLSHTPERDGFDKMDIAKYLPDEIVLGTNALYLYCPNGYGNTKLTNTFLEKKLNAKATTRNLKTSNELLRIANGFL